MSNSERKYRKQVNKNGWMAKLHRICFGEATPTFVGYCPFFWFTWFCILFFPLIMIVRLVITIIYGFVCVFRAIPPMRPSDILLYSFYDKYLEYGGGQEVLNYIRDILDQYRKVLRWIAVTPDWENCAKQVRYKIQQRQAKQQEKAVANAQRAKTLSKYAGYVVKPTLGAIALFSSYQFIRLMIWIVRQFTWAGFIFAAEIVGFAIGIGLVISILVSGIKIGHRLLRKCPKNPNKIGFWSKVGNAIGNGLEFIAETIETLYTRECPLIEWGNETRPIEKR